MTQKLVWMVLVLGLGTTLLYGAPQMANDKDSGTQTVTGCLQKGVEPTGFFLVSTEAKHWELYPNTGVSLAEHIGHTVTLTGTVAHRSKTQEEKSQPNEKKEIGVRQHADLQVSGLKMVSTTCSK
ncbi:MAG TPA: hypothetical protein VKH45_14965 [Candidatus Acidoferrum sp.]|nr:hypothetical protein [Candidatus Acidoferrum sp.]